VALLGIFVLLHAYLMVHEGVLFGKAGRTSINSHEDSFLFWLIIITQSVLGLVIFFYGGFLLFGVDNKLTRFINWVTEKFK